ncbi:CD59 glycoprotein-like [Lepisosteus oculatus]|uniref:CD59 glycoprotein-like n=1 Tax=Lepisosteus oculatus TaxID=7918 RepID=UPI0037211BAD
MKSLALLAAFLLVFLSFGEALRCYHCLAPGQGGRPGSCRTTVETCTGLNDVCVSAIFLPPASGYFRRCGKSSDCPILNMGGVIKASCCRTDLCN